MKRARSKAGFTLIELLLAFVIMIFLLIGIGVGMQSGSKVYQDATFESDSSLLADTLNNSLGDILRYSQNVRVNRGGMQDSLGNTLSPTFVPFTFTNAEYGVQDAYLSAPNRYDGNQIVIQIHNTQNSDVIELVNAGAYPNLSVTNMKISFVTPDQDTAGGTGYFDVSYTICSSNNTKLYKEINTVIRLMNEP